MPGIRYTGPKEPHLSQAQARKKLGKRKAPAGVYSPLAGLPEFATVPAPASIVELARALKNDVDLIYEWVYSNVDFYCMWGLHKGALGTLIDRIGGSFEQSALMEALLTQAGYTASSLVGSIRLTRAQIEQLLGTTETTDLHPSQTMLEYGNIPHTASYDGSGLLDYMDMDHAWVQVTISGTEYVFDPSYKTYDYITGIDVGAACQFDSQALSDLIDAAQVGMTSGDVYVQNINSERYEETDGIRPRFKTYGTNLLNWIRTNAFDASMEEIIGGRNIHPLSSQPVRQTSLSYQTPDSGTRSVQDTDRATYRVQFAGINHLFNAA